MRLEKYFEGYKQALSANDNRNVIKSETEIIPGPQNVGWIQKISRSSSSIKYCPSHGALENMARLKFLT